MKRNAIVSRMNVLIAVLLLGFGLAGVALAQRVSSTVQADVTILDGGKIRVSPMTFAPGMLTLVAVNKGKLPHALAIMGTALEPKRTPTIGTGKTARLTVTVKVGMYHVWDPVRSSMSHATMLTVRATNTPATSSPSPPTSGSGSTSGGSGPSSTTPSGGGMAGMGPGDPGAM